MINHKSVLAIIPARGGSKSVLRKNIKDLAGKPLIAWTIEEAQKSIYIDRLILSSEDEEIIEVARNWGCEVPFVRPAELAQDDTPGIEPVLHAIKTLVDGYDYVILLQPTSPLRRVVHIDGCLERCVGASAPACVSVAEAQQSPFWMYSLDETMSMHPIIEHPGIINQRQDLPKVYVLNGAIYVAETRFVNEKKTFFAKETIAYPMPAEMSIDIDNELDFAYCEWLIHQG